MDSLIVSVETCYLYNRRGEKAFVTINDGSFTRIEAYRHRVYPTKIMVWFKHKDEHFHGGVGKPRKPFKARRIKGF